MPFHNLGDRRGNPYHMVMNGLAAVRHEVDRIPLPRLEFLRIVARNVVEIQPVPNPEWTLLQPRVGVQRHTGSPDDRLGCHERSLHRACVNDIDVLLLQQSGRAFGLCCTLTGEDWVFTIVTVEPVIREIRLAVSDIYDASAFFLLSHGLRSVR